jgi:hypothetical protein
MPHQQSQRNVLKMLRPADGYSGATKKSPGNFLHQTETTKKQHVLSEFEVAPSWRCAPGTLAVTWSACQALEGHL